MTKRTVYVGTYTEAIRFGTGKIFEGQAEGIYVLELDTASGALGAVDVVDGRPNPSYLAVDPERRFLYAVNETKEYQGAETGAVSAYAMDAESGTLRFLNRRPSHGTDPCYVAVHPGGGFVLVANYASGSVSVYPVADDGSLGEASDTVQHEGSSVHPVRQAGPHAHAATPDEAGRYVYVPELGLDRVMVYRLDAERGTLEPHDPPWVEATAGAGPRQIALHPDGGYAYVINELDSTMTAYRYDGERGTLQALQTLSTLPEGYAGDNSGAEVQVAPSGRFLYGSNRGHDSIVIYAIDAEEGTLSLVGHESVQGKTPRHFCIDPTGEWLLAANQDSNNVTVFALDADTGALTYTGHSIDVPTPVCVRVV
jgi:6-phosphogluconolactonase